MLVARVRPKKRPIAYKGGLNPSAVAQARPPARRIGVSHGVPRTGPPAAAPGLTPAQQTVQNMMPGWQAPRPLVVPPPMPSLRTTQDRIAARSDFTGRMGDINQQLRNLAANYGGVDKVLQFGFNPDAWNRDDPSGMFSSSDLGVQASQPGSVLETLLRQLNANKQNINDTALGQNTFFSSKRIGDLGLADSDYAGQVAQAKRDYDNAIANLLREMTGAQGTLTTNLSNADITDIDAANAAAPEAQASGPMTGQEILNSLPFNLEISRGATWAVYPDGHKEVLSGTPVAPYKKPKPKPKRKK